VAIQIQDGNSKLSRVLTALLLAQRQVRADVRLAEIATALSIGCERDIVVLEQLIKLNVVSTATKNDT
jgi:hypothetical protein